MFQALRVEWAKSWARWLRWTEEVALLQEEMCRTIAYCNWRATWWDERVNMRVGVSLGLQEGLRASAVRQSLIQKGRTIHFQTQWSASEPQAQNLPAIDPDWVTANLGHANDDDDSADE
jgi:hypothetical protein